MPDEFLTVAEVAELLKLNPQTVYNWLDWGELPAVRVGSRRVRVRRTDLDRFLGPGRTDERREPEPAAVDEGSITVWAAFGAAMAEATAALQGPDRDELVSALGPLADATQSLASALHDPP